MRNIVLTRIDDRLIHGQVVTAWIRRYPINCILIVDDELAQNRLMERIYKAAAPVGVEVLIKSVQDAGAWLSEDEKKENKFLFWLKYQEQLKNCLSRISQLKKLF